MTPTTRKIPETNNSKEINVFLFKVQREQVVHNFLNAETIDKLNLSNNPIVTSYNE